MNVIDSNYSSRGLMFLSVNLTMSRKLVKIITGVAVTIAVVILIAVITAVTITTVNEDNELENKVTTKEQQIDVIEKETSSMFLMIPAFSEII